MYGPKKLYECVCVCGGAGAGGGGRGRRGAGGEGRTMSPDSAKRLFIAVPWPCRRRRRHHHHHHHHTTTTTATTTAVLPAGPSRARAGTGGGRGGPGLAGGQRLDPRDRVPHTHMFPLFREI